MTVDDRARRAHAEAVAAVTVGPPPPVERLAARRRRRRLAAGGAVVAIALVGGAAAGAGLRGDGGGLTSPPAGDGELLLTCDGGASTFPATALEGPSGADAGTDPAAGVLRRAIDDPSAVGIEPVPAAGWRRLVGGDDHVLFGTQATGALVVVGVVRRDGTWALDRAGHCRAEPWREGARAATWVLDPAHPVQPDATQVRVLATEVGCASGRPPGDRLLLPPAVDRSTDAVTITFFVVPAGGDQECPGNPSVAVTVDLGEPLGDRRLLDGGVWPPTAVPVLRPGDRLGPFPRSGGCADVVFWAADEADQSAMFVEVHELLADAPTTFEATLPDRRVGLEVVLGERLTSMTCTDLPQGGEPDVQVWLEPVAGTVTVTVGERAADGTAVADLAVRDLVVAVPGGARVEVENVVLTDVEVGRLAG